MQRPKRQQTQTQLRIFLLETRRLWPRAHGFLACFSEISADLSNFEKIFLGMLSSEVYFIFPTFFAVQKRSLRGRLTARRPSSFHKENVTPQYYRFQGGQERTKQATYETSKFTSNARNKRGRPQTRASSGRTNERKLGEKERRPQNNGKCGAKSEVKFRCIFGGLQFFFKTPVDQTVKRASPDIDFSK